MFKEVKVRDIDPKDPLLFSTRKIEIKTAKQNAFGPSRIASIYEYDRKTAIPTEDPIDNPVSISVRKMGTNRVESFLKENGAYKHLAHQIADEQDRMKYSSLRIHIIQPSIRKYKTKDKDGNKITVNPAVDFLANNTHEREDFLRLTTKLQLDADLDIISIPYLKLPLSDYKQLIKKSVETIRKLEKEPLVVFDLFYRPFRGAFAEAIKYFIKEAQVKIFAFPNSSFGSASASYTALSHHVEDAVAFLSFDVLRSYRSPSNMLSKMHSIPFIGTDLYSIQTPKMFPNEDDKIEERTTDSVKFFNRDNLLIEPSEIRVQDPDKILEEMDCKDNKELKDILKNYDNIGTDQEKINVLNSLSRIHELKTSSKEFELVRDRIKSGESTTYVDEKPNLKSTLKVLQKKKPKEK